MGKKGRGGGRERKEEEGRKGRGRREEEERKRKGRGEMRITRIRTGGGKEYCSML